MPWFQEFGQFFQFSHPIACIEPYKLIKRNKAVVNLSGQQVYMFLLIEAYLLCTHLTPPISVQELNIVWSLWSQATVRTEPGDLSSSLGAASGRFMSYTRKVFSMPPVSNRWVSCSIFGDWGLEVKFKVINIKGSTNRVEQQQQHSL